MVASSAHRLPSGRTAGLNAQIIVEAALALLERDGLPQFGMRSLARDLGVTPGALYKHVRDRDEVLGAVAALILAQVEVPRADLAWTDWLRAYAHSYRGTVQRHPAAAPLLSSSMASNSPADLPIVEVMLETLSRAGFRGKALIDAFNAVTGAISGYVGVEFATPPAENAEAWSARLESALAGASPAAFPRVAAHRRHLRAGAFIVRVRSGADMPLSGGFECMVDALVTGLQRQAQE